MTMIPLLSIAPQRASELVVDPFVPIRFRASPEFRGNNIVGSLGDHRFSISELKIDRSTGEVYAFTLIEVRYEVTAVATNTYGNLSRQDGTPVVDLARLTFHEGRDGGPAHFDELTDLRSQLIVDVFVVMFNDAATPTRLIDTGNGFFIADADSLVGFMTKPLKSAALATIKEWVASSGRP